MAKPDGPPRPDVAPAPEPEGQEVAPRERPARGSVIGSPLSASQLHELSRLSRQFADIARLAGWSDAKQVAAIIGTQGIAQRIVTQNAGLDKQFAPIVEQFRASQFAPLRVAMPDHQRWLASITGTYAQSVTKALKGWTPGALASLTRLQGVVPASILEPSTMAAFRHILGDQRLADAAAASFVTKVARDAQAVSLRQMGLAPVDADDKRVTPEVSEALSSLGVAKAPESVESFADLADIDNEAALEAARAAWDAEVEQSFDAAADAIVANSPWLSREKVRLGIKVFVLVAWVTGLTALAFIPGLTGTILANLISSLTTAPTVAELAERAMPKPEDPAD